MIVVCALAVAGAARGRRSRLACGRWSWRSRWRRCWRRPAAWAVDTLGHATSSTFPAGGPASAGGFGGGPGGFGGRGGARGGFAGGWPWRAAFGGRAAGRSGASAGGASGGGSVGWQRRCAAAPAACPAGGGMFGGDSSTLRAASRYAASHGGGTVAVESQSSAAAAIVAGETTWPGSAASPACESSVSASWLAMEVRDGRLRWIVADTGGGFGGGVSPVRLGASGRRGRCGRCGWCGGRPRVAALVVRRRAACSAAPRVGFGLGHRRWIRDVSVSGSSGGAMPSGAGIGFADGRTGSAKAFAIAEKVGRKVTITRRRPDRDDVRPQGQGVGDPGGGRRSASSLRSPLTPTACAAHRARRRRERIRRTGRAANPRARPRPSEPGRAGAGDSGPGPSSDRELGDCRTSHTFG